MFFSFFVFILVLISYVITLPLNLYIRYLIYRGKLKKASNFAGKVTPIFSKAFIRILSTKFTLVGRENVDTNKTYLIVANHNSLLDVFMINGYLGKFAGFVGKTSLRKTPLASTWINLGICASVDQKDPKKALEGINHCTYLLKNNISQVIFPEGTRSVDGKLQEFKPGAFKPAIKAGVEVLPVTIIGMNKVLPKGSKILKRNKTMLVISKPVSSYEKNTVELSQEVRNIISSSLEKYGELC